MVSEHSYKSIIALTIFVGILLLITFVNPNTFHKGYFNDTTQDTQYNTIDLSSNTKIIEYIESRTKWASESALDLKRQNKISEEQADKINEEAIEAQRELDAYKSSKNENDLYMALFKTQEVVFYKKAYPFFNCEDEVYNTSKKYYWLFYYMGDSDRKKVLDLHDTRKYMENALGYSTQYIEDINRTIMLTRDAENIENRYNIYRINCDFFKDYINKDYKRQRYWFIIKLLAVIAIFLVGLVLGNLISKRNIKKFEKHSNSLTNKIKNVFYPKEVKEETIKSILSINSVTTTILSFFGILLTISGFNNWFMVGLMLISVLLLITSILLGVIAMNNKNPKYQLWCYRFFIFGLTFFVFFFAYILIGGIISEFFKAASESMKTYLNNQTIK